MADLTNKEQNQTIKTTRTQSANTGFGSNSLGADDNGVGAAFGNPYLTRQGVKAGVRLPTTTVEIPVTTTAPAKAPAAPTGNTGHLFTGLAEALNTYQNQLVKDKKQSIADVYEFEFEPTTLGASKTKKAGSTDKSKTAGKNVTTAKQALDPKTDSVDNNSQNYMVESGMQIVQLIDQIMRNSDYVALQANTTFDPVTQEPSPSNGTGTGMVTWYNITVTATSLGLDSIRNDFAYQIKYTITPYALSKLQSEFFPESVYRGSHKSYNYWFTGTNTQILNFEQVYNALYKLVISGNGPLMKNSKITNDYRDQYSYAVMPTTSQKTGQSTGTYTPTVPDSAADFLYSPTDYSIAKVKIVGDPAWLQQGSVCGASGSQNFNFQPFNPDGSINYDSQQVVFDISWNQPQDYDMETGVMNIKGDQQGRARVNNTYIARECTSTFNRGRFEQEIEGMLLIEDKVASAPVAKPVEKPVATPAPTVPTKIPVPKFDPYELNEAVNPRLTQPRLNRFNFKSKNRVTREE